MAETNIILGYGETLTKAFPLKRGSGNKKYPYTLEEQQSWLGGQLSNLLALQRSLPIDLKPRGEAVARFTLHPTFLAKTHHPNALLVASGLRCIGSKSTTITPRKRTSAKIAQPGPAFTATLFVAGREEAFQKLTTMLGSSSTAKTHQEALRRFEIIDPFAAAAKVFVHATDKAIVTLEVVLHASAADQDIVKAFASYTTELDGKMDERALYIGGLTFIPVMLPAANIEALAAFSFVRAIRTMPSLRIGGRTMRATSITPPALPAETALAPDIRVGIFDGGIGHTDLAPWVTETVMPGAESTSAAYLSHGNGVTSAALFGALDDKAPVMSRPYANIEHYRVIAPSLQHKDGVFDADLYDVLQHIDGVLSQNSFDFLNFSIGPYMPMDDDEVHPWTALIDRHLAHGNTFASIAVGNDGTKAWPESRIQPPSDMVNAVAVGACNSSGEQWERADYSSHGPGRSPGLVKPDGVAFGGCENEPFTVFNALTGELAHTSGTSFSSPSLLHTAIGIKASLNFPISALAVRALLLHHADRPNSMAMSHVGHGRFPRTVDEVLTCDDNEVRVIYQGTLNAGENLRAFVPFPTLPLNGRVILRATLCFASQTDPEHAINYTRAGLSVCFRPKNLSKKTMPFFSASKMYTSELEARMDEHKWETSLKHEHRFQSDTLENPLFDITYGAREEGQSVDNHSLPPLPYAMVISLSVENTPGIYNNIRQRYQTLQPVQVRQEVRLKSSPSTK